MVQFLRPFDSRRLRLLIFDLDGTLIDSRLDLIHSINAMLRHLERPELPSELIASYVGDGAPTLVRRALDANSDNDKDNDQDSQIVRSPFGGPNVGHDPLLQEALDYFLAYYSVHKLDHTTVYEGIPEVLAALASPQMGTEPPHAQRLMAVLSNKPVNPSRDIVQALGLGDYFIRVYGGNSFPTKKPDPLGARTLLEETGVAPDEALMIGDSAIDILTGRNARMWTCGVTYGFSPHTLKAVTPDVLLDTPTEIGELLS